MTLKNEYIFFMGTTKFDGPEQSASYTIARQLAKNNFVFYIDYPFTVKDYFSKRSSDQVKRRKPYFSPFSKGTIPTELPNLKVVITPLLLSINFLPEGRIYRMILKLNELLIIRRLKKLIRENHISQFIYINSFNFHYPGVADTLNPKLQVYHCVDPMIMPYDKKHGIISEEELVRKSDVVICTSRQLYKEKKLQNSNTYFIPNAADINHFNKALHAETPIHQSVSKLQRPVIGYTGNIERRMDYNLLKEVIAGNPDKSFVFAGYQNPEYIPEWFGNTPNVHLTGKFSFEEMPRIVKGFDIAIIPFKKDEVSSTIFPLKLFEYLGTGKPVICTNFNPDIQEFTEDTVSFCNDAQSFSGAIQDILQNDTFAKQQDRLTVAAKNTWERRAAQFAEVIHTNLK